MAIIAILVYLALSFGFTSLLLYLACWAFGLAFSWKIAFGVWVVMALIRSCFNSSITVNK